MNINSVADDEKNEIVFACIQECDLNKRGFLLQIGQARALLYTHGFITEAENSRIARRMERLVRRKWKDAGLDV